MMDEDLSSLPQYCSTIEDSVVTLALDLQCHRGVITNLTVISVCTQDDIIIYSHSAEEMSCFHGMMFSNKIFYLAINSEKIISM